MIHATLWKWRFAFLPVRTTTKQLVWLRWVQRRTVLYRDRAEYEYRMIDSSCWYCGHEWQPRPDGMRVVCPECCCENNFED